VHVIGLRVKNYTWTGEQSVTETKCLANETGGYYITVETEDELTEALQKTLGLPDDDRAAISALRSARR
jgi:Ca-activated chloride channel family protein